MRIKPIRTDEDYDEAIVFLRELIEADHPPGSAEDDQIDVLTTLIEDYEDKNFPLELPTAVEAIQFRMEQAGLRQVDLVPYIGSATRVSEILSGKRALTIEMVRKLEKGLGIPAKVLIRKQVDNTAKPYANWNKRLFSEMKKRGYFDGISENAPIEMLKQFFTPFSSNSLAPALHRQSSYRAAMVSDEQAIEAWKARVLQRAKGLKVNTSYSKSTITKEFMQEIARMSIYEDGPTRAVRAILEKGIALVIEPHLPGTRLDGAVLMSNEENPVIGLTLRYDRVDNFWFTLLHELAHVCLHFDKIDKDIIDEFEPSKNEKVIDIEAEADELAGEVLVPEDKWILSPVRVVPNVLAARQLARELGVDVAIVAGKIRHEHGNWSYMNKLVSERKVRHLFLDSEEKA